MIISRHFADVGNRRVHYRLAGKGPPLLMIHQGPRSSAELEPLIAKWCEHFTCIAPDTPGFGLSTPLAETAQIDDFADAVAEFLDAVGLEKVAGYGFHSGGVLLMNTLRRHPDKFSGIAIGGYAVWTDEEQGRFNQVFAPTFVPMPFGEHLVWLWNRALEQSWFFPWFDTHPEKRLSMPHADPLKVDVTVREMLDSGPAYQIGFAAVLRAPRGIRFAADLTTPVLVTAYDGDPLKAHIARLDPLPAAWTAYSVTSPAEQEEASLAFLLRHQPPQQSPPGSTADEGFAHVATNDFEGLIHWRGDHNSPEVVIHRPGGSIELIEPAGRLLIDLPGHGLSSDFRSTDIEAWARVVAASIQAISTAQSTVIVGEGLSALLAVATGKQISARAVSTIDAHIPLEADTPAWLAHYPDLDPDRFGGHLIRAWSTIRAENFYWPWFDVSAANAISFEPTDVEPASLALRHRSLMRAVAGKDLLTALLTADRVSLFDTAPPIVSWHLAGWAHDNEKIWRPAALY